MNTDVVRQGSGDVEILQGWTPAALRAQIVREKELRSIIIEYYQSCMVEGHHYYRLDDDEKKKPALTKEGALALCHLFKSHPHPEPPVETWTPDGHYGVRSSVSIIERSSGEVIAEGVGYCSTRESKYAYRSGARTCPKCRKAAIIKGREDYGGGWVCFRKKDGCGAKFKDGDSEIESQPTGRVPNEDLPDQYNTALKMSHKRAMVDAALAVPLVSEIFTQDLEEQIEERARGMSTESASPPVQKGSPTPKVPLEPGSEKQPLPKPTKDEVTQLLQLLQRVYQDEAKVKEKVHAVLQIPATHGWSDFRVRDTMTRTHYTTLQDEATAYAMQQNVSTDDDVQDFSGSEPTQDASDLTWPPGATPETSEAMDAAEWQAEAEGDPPVGSASYASTDKPATSAVPDLDEMSSATTDVAGDDFRPVETDAQGFVTAPEMEKLVHWADQNRQQGLLRQMRAETSQMNVGRYRYCWVQLGSKKSPAKA